MKRANIKDKVYSYIVRNNMITAGDRIILGLSGGADSVCLLLLLKDLEDKLQCQITAVHVHHGIRGEEADRDADFAKALCDRLGIDMVMERRNIPEIAKQSHESEEECGRRIRYEIFEKLSRDMSEKEQPSLSGKVRIAVAHHMLDQAETIIFRMARGTGIKGLRGMLPTNGRIIRPLLCLTKEEILDYLEEKGEGFCLDATNEELQYHRNYIRNQIIPGLSNINTAAVSHIVELSEEASQLYSYIESKASELLEAARINGESGKYNINVLRGEDELIRKAAIRLIIEREGLPLKDVSREHIDMILTGINSNEYSCVMLPKDNRFVMEAGRIYVAGPSDGNNRLPEAELEKAFETELLSDFDRSCIPQNLYTKWFDYDKILNSLCIRYRCSGDYLVVNSGGGLKSLKDYMINEKIPKSRRDNIPLVADGSKIIWVVGYRISEDVKVTEETRRVLKVCYRPKKDI